MKHEDIDHWRHAYAVLGLSLWVGWMGHAVAATEFKDCAQCPDMVVIPAGTFTMGSSKGEVGRLDNEGPKHKVTLPQAFAVGKFEVTVEEWAACVADHGCTPAKEEASGSGQSRHPMVHISHEQARTYASWLSTKTGKNYRLLSEAEWEYAARAGSDQPRPWEATMSGPAEPVCMWANGHDQRSHQIHHYPWQAMTCDDGFAETAPVGSFKPNAFGLHDMLGNVWEWVADCYKKNYDGAPTDGSAQTTSGCHQRVFRGGGWDFGAMSLRSAVRDADTPHSHGSMIGLRVARGL